MILLRSVERMICLICLVWAASGLDCYVAALTPPSSQDHCQWTRNNLNNYYYYNCGRRQFDNGCRVAIPVSTRRPSSRGAGRRTTPLSISLFQRGEPEDQAVSSDLASMEREVLASAQETMDRKRIDALLRDSLKEERLAVVSSSTTTAPQWMIAIAAGGVSAGLSYLALENAVLTMLLSLSVAFVAFRDPLSEEDAAGAMARWLGRSTLRSVEASTPKVKAIARAAMVGDEEILQLRQEVARLESENAELKLYKFRREKVDDMLSEFTLSDLKDKARQNKLPVGGTKTQLLMRLVEANIIDVYIDR